MDFSVLGITTIFILFISLLLALFVLTVKTNSKKANRFLGVYFLIFAIHISVFFYSKYITLPSILEMLRDHIAFFTSPLLFLYIISSIYSDFKLKPNHLLHLLPFIVQILIFSPRFYFANINTRNFLLENLNNTIEGKLSIIFGLFIAFFYLTAMFLELRKYKQLLLENYSNKSAFNYKWLYQLLILLSIIFCFSFFKQTYKFFGTNVEILNILRVILTLTLLVFLTWIVLKSMYYPDLFRNINSEHTLAKKILIEDSITNKSEKDSREDISRLLEFMETEEPYLDATLTLQKLADKIELPNRDVSIMINHNLNQHFFDFINQFRIQKAQNILLNPKNNQLTIQQIMYEVGFNSKSSFYTAFKKQTGVTPSEYRKTHNSLT
ncbi:helix-turn-helix domain-containing protein [Winogradskyella flava]|uniref:Helix-turn-helix transcriptional regulator n=1 Tax=Winogradskyella flava TaxID=1884876 RepID=A0A842IVF5_9FLAO|nr:AraC family transcriptional regulator [Winogradskyella flava]MBC2845726.1 helix-turn-helix transcriptional regulator [Winogradskyella flava]